MKKKRYAQSAVELTVVLAIGLVVLIAIISIFSETQTSFSGQLGAKKARTFVDTLADAAEMVYQQGVGARTKMYVTIPDNVNYIDISDQLILMNSYVGGDERNTYRTLNFNVVGTIPVEEGNLWLYIEAKEGFVSISK